MPKRHETSDPSQTEALGAELAAGLAAGDVVLVEGELGAGKTTFVRGACRALGVGGVVTSPTFTIGQRYPAAVPVSHLDLYRVADLGARTPTCWRTTSGRTDRVRRMAGARGGDDRGPVTPGREGDDRARRRRPASGDDRAVRIFAFDTATRQPRLRCSASATSSPRPATTQPGRAARPRHAAAAADCDGARARRRRLGRGRPDRSRHRARDVHRAADRDRDRAGARTGEGHSARRGFDPAVARARRTFRERRAGRFDTVLAVLDARRGEVFAASWRMTEIEEFDTALLVPRHSLPRRWPSSSRRSDRPHWRSETGR